jgi:hypothetical protein
MERPEDVRFGCFRKVNRFCVASTFDVKNAVVAPDVFVVTDQTALRICREGGLAGAR